MFGSWGRKTIIKWAYLKSLTIVIPAYNEQNRLPATLKRCWPTSMPKSGFAEVIAVNDDPQATPKWSGRRRGRRPRPLVENPAIAARATPSARTAGTKEIGPLHRADLVAPNEISANSPPR